MFPTSAVISAGMHNIKSPPESPQHSIPTRRSMKDLLGLSRQAPARPLTPPRPEPVTPMEPVSQHEVSPVSQHTISPLEETPDSQRTIIHRRPTLRSSAPVSPTAHRGSVQRLNLARAIQVNNPGDNFSYISSQSSRSRDSYPSTAVPPSTAIPPSPPTRRIASSIYSRTASGYFLPLDHTNDPFLALAADAAAARTFLTQNADASAASRGLASPRSSIPLDREGREGREREGGLSPFPCTNTDPERPLPYGTKGWASSGPYAASSVAARRANEEKEAEAEEEASASAARKERKERKGRVLRRVVHRILGRR